MLDPNTPPGTRIVCVLTDEYRFPNCRCGKGFMDVSRFLTVGKVYTLDWIEPATPDLICYGHGVAIVEYQDLCFLLPHFRVAETRDLPEEISKALDAKPKFRITESVP